jgi:hypothetical protein
MTAGEFSTLRGEYRSRAPNRAAHSGDMAFEWQPTKEYPYNLQ